MKETVDINILVTSRIGDRKIMQSIRIMSRPTSRTRKWKKLSQFRWTFTKLIPIHFDNQPGLREAVSEIQSNFRRKKQKLQRTNQSSKFLEPQSNLEEKVNASILKDYFSSRKDSSIFTSKASVLAQSNKTSWVLPTLKWKSHFLPQSTVPHRSDSSSEANSSCCHRSDA